MTGSPEDIKRWRAIAAWWERKGMDEFIAAMKRRPQSPEESDRER